MDDLAAANKTISLQIKALQHVRDNLGTEFKAALGILQEADRICVTGVGKSGHIARKVASTLTSLGSPAYFLHPTDASHGDLGIIGERDAVLMLSKSANSEELWNIRRHCMSHDLPVVLVTANPKGRLAQLMETYDVMLCLPMIAEAHVTQAPTTSTTAMLALGDALAVSLAKHTTATQFRTLHPGGTLGISNGCYNG